MFTLGGKTPVSILQEYVVSKNIIVSYELTQKGVGTHNPEFTVSVKVGSQWSEGTGRSKQEAKHRAAERMIRKLKLVDSGNENPDDGHSEFCKSDFKENYVGLLKDYCHSHQYPEPKYYVEEEAGPPHSKIFKMICCVSQLQDFGISTTKKLAKQQAASKMLDRLKKLTKENGNASAADGSASEFVEYKIIQKIPEKFLTDAEILDKYKAVKASTVTSYKEPAVFYKDHYKAFEGLQETSPKLATLMETNLTFNEEDSLNYIKEIAKELEVSVKCTKLKCCEESGNDFVIMTMSVAPPIAGIGTDDQTAAFDLLSSLLCFCK